jgi:photoactive yellow protein
VENGKTYHALPFGWIELDAAGIVTRYSPAGEGKTATNASPNLVGCNLFRDIAPIAEVKEFRDRFQVFVKSPLPTEVFKLTFNDCDNCINARIMLAQISEHHQSQRYKLFLVRVTKA